MTSTPLIQSAAALHTAMNLCRENGVTRIGRTRNACRCRHPRHSMGTTSINVRYVGPKAVLIMSCLVTHRNNAKLCVTRRLALDGCGQAAFRTWSCPHRTLWPRDERWPSETITMNDNLIWRMTQLAHDRHTHSVMCVPIVIPHLVARVCFCVISTGGNLS